jgi:hypothetical protein
MLRQKSLLVSLVVPIDRLPWPPEPTPRPRGHPKTYSERLVMKALVIRLFAASTRPMPYSLFSTKMIPWRYGCDPSCANTAAFPPVTPGNIAWPRCRRACPA